MSTPALEMRRTLVCSTAHVTLATRNKFERQDPRDCHLPLIGCFEYGWYLWVPPHIESWLEDYGHELGEDEKALLRFANEHGFHEIKLDADADPIEGLHVYDWEAQTQH